MALLRDLLDLNATTGGIENPPVRTIFVYNAATATVSNGGQACTWTVPADVTWVGVEMWGGGGSGGGVVSCCGTGWGGGHGAYARKLMTVTPGDVYTICAAGTTNCPTTMTGTVGGTSYMCKNGVSCMTAAGGIPGQNCCCWFCGFNHPCCNPEPAAGFTGASFGICATHPMHIQACQSNCHNIPVVSGAPLGNPNLLFGIAYCCHWNGSQHMDGVLFPGGGGMPASSWCCNGSYQRCGGVGAGGLVSLIYYSTTAP